MVYEKFRIVDVLKNILNKIKLFAKKVLKLRGFYLIGLTRVLIFKSYLKLCFMHCCYLFAY